MRLTCSLLFVVSGCAAASPPLLCEFRNIEFAQEHMRRGELRAAEGRLRLELESNPKSRDLVGWQLVALRILERGDEYSKQVVRDYLERGIPTDTGTCPDASAQTAPVVTPVLSLSSVSPPQSLAIGVTGCSRVAVPGVPDFLTTQYSYESPYHSVTVEQGHVTMDVRSVLFALKARRTSSHTDLSRLGDAVGPSSFGVAVGERTFDAAANAVELVLQQIGTSSATIVFDDPDGSLHAQLVEFLEATNTLCGRTVVVPLVPPETQPHG